MKGLDVALNAYMTITGKKQGEIKGGSVVKGREGSIIVRGASHEILSPRDRASGLPTGPRVHQPFAVTKELDPATPALYRALAENEPLNVVIRFWRPRAATAPTTGTPEEQYYTVRLVNASVAALSMTMPDTTTTDKTPPETEHLTLSYEQIVWTWTATGAEASDTWRSQG